MVNHVRPLFLARLIFIQTKKQNSMADMDNQPKENLMAADAVKKIKEMAEGVNACLLQTGLKEVSVNIIPMSIQEVDQDGVLWFISSSESEHNQNIERDQHVIVTIQNDSKFQYLSLNGYAQIHSDKSLIEKYWTDLANAWFEGKDDPRVRVISVRPNSGHYWDTKNGKIVSGIKMLFSAITGADVDDGGVDGQIIL